MASNGRKSRVRSAVILVAGAVAAGVLSVYIALVAVHGDLAVGGWIIPFLVLEVICGWVIIEGARRRLPEGRSLIVSSVVAALIFMLSLVGTFLWARWAPAIEFDGSNPAATGCADAEVTQIANQWIVYGTNPKIELATVRQMYSTVCNTTWLRVQTVDPELSTAKTIARAAGDWLWPFTTGPVHDPATDQWTFGDQIVAPACAEISVEILREDRIVGQLTTSCG